MGFMKDWTDKWRRRFDVDELWPACKHNTQSDRLARILFLAHIRTDRSWTDHFSEDELQQFVRDL